MNKSEVQPIPRMPDEPTGWYSRLVSFCLMGPGRSVLRVYNDEREKAGKSGKARSIPGPWQKIIDRFRWRDRAARYDLETIEFERDQQNQLRLSERRKRLDLLRMFRRKIASALKTFNVGTASLGQIAAAVRVLGEESRSELELAELARQVADLERTAPDDSSAADRFRAEMRRLAGGPTDEAA